LHVYGCCEEGRRHEKQERLSDVRSQGPVRRFLAGGKTCDIADSFNYRKRESAEVATWSTL
jgi:hypothetical protein